METVSSEDILFAKPDIREFLNDYNNLLASILAGNFPSLKYLASATINRLEAQTHFYEQLEKYLQLRDYLLAHQNCTIILKGKDTFLYEDLKREFGGKVATEGRSCDLLRAKLRFVFFSWWASLLKVLFFSVLGRMVDKPSSNYDFIIRTYFDYRCEGPDGSMREEYFGPFAEDLGKSKHTLVVFKAISASLSGFRQYCRIRRQAPWDSCLWESLLTPVTVVKSYIRYLSSRIRLSEKVIFKNVDITSLLQKKLDEDYFQRRGLNVYLEYEVAREMFGFRPGRIFMPYENQPWEKVYPWVRSEMNGASSIVGFQHTGVSFKLLNYFPCLAEQNLPVYPDMIFTVGEVFTQLLREKAYFPCAVRTGAALRHFRSMRDGKFIVRPRGDDKLTGRIVYAFSYDLANYREIVDLLAECFGGTDIEVYLRFHPDYDENEVLASLERVLPANFIPARSLTWEMIYRSVDLVLYDDNSIGLEAMLHGVLTLLLDIEPVYNCDRMFYFTAWPTSVDRQGLVELRNRLLQGTFANPFDAATVQQYLQQYYTPYTTATYEAFTH